MQLLRFLHLGVDVYAYSCSAMHKIICAEFLRKWFVCHMLSTALPGFALLLSRCALSASFESLNASVRHGFHLLNSPQKPCSALDLQISLLEMIQRWCLNSHNFSHVLGPLLDKIYSIREVGIFPFQWDLYHFHLTLERTQESNSSSSYSLYKTV